MKLEIREIGNGYVVSWNFGLFIEGEKYFGDKRKAVAAAKRRLDMWIDGEA